MQLFSNNADASLNGAIASDTAVLVLKAGQGSKFPSPSNGDYFLVTIFERLGTTELNHEIVKCTSRTNDSLTVSRGQEGTVAKAFPDGSLVELRVTAGTLENKVEKVTGKSLSTEDFTTAEKSKLAGIAAAATANSADAQLRDRTTHTGTQAIATIDGLSAALNNKLSDAPSDGKTYGRKNAAWAEVVADWSAVTGKPAVIAAGADAAAARAAIGAGTSNLAIGTTASTAKAGNYVPTKADVGLGNVDNTSDANKPVSTAQLAAINAKQATLVSGTNIKTINGATVLGAGDLTVSGGVPLDSGFNTVGSFCFAKVLNSNSVCEGGSTFPGSSLWSASTNGGTISDGSGGGGSALNGTWRLMGRIPASSNYASLFQRIA